MRLNELKDNPGSRKTRVRVGRGIGSGVGKTAGRGVKGQKSRSGVSIGGFEGGQMPLNRRMPKRGFSKYRRKSYNEINLGALQQAIDEGRIPADVELNNTALVEAGVLRREKDGLRLLGSGELKSKIKIEVVHATASAKVGVEKAGGSVLTIEKKVLAADEEKRAKTAAKRAAKAEGKSKGKGKGKDKDKGK